MLGIDVDVAAAIVLDGDIGDTIAELLEAACLSSLGAMELVNAGEA